MSANRKLQGEIQIVLKKVEEGVEIFDEIWGKVYAAEQQTLKEKYESDLKKEIKKLQRLRDQIKTWLSSNEIKDKTQIMEARKTIESKMELFKVCEKDTKTKAYSKEGLAREAKLDPKEALKEEKRGWLNDCLDKLNDLIDSVEAEREKVLGTSKGKSKNKESLERFDNRVQKHKWHMAKLELIIKLLDNDDLDPSLVSGIQDSLDYYIESAVDDDGALGVEHEFDIYEELELDSHGVAAPTFDLARPAKEDEDSPGAAVAASAGNDTADVTESEAPAPAAKKATVPAGVAAKGKAEPAATAAPTKAAAAAAPLGAKASPKVVPAVPAAATTTKNGASKANGGPKAAATVAASASDEADESSADSLAPAAASAAAPASGPSMSWAAHAASAVPAASAPAPAPTASSRPQAAAPVPAATVTPSPAVVPVPAPAATAAAQQQQSVKSPAVSSVPSPALVPAKATSLLPQAASVVEAPPLPAAVPAAAVLSPAATASAPPPPPPLQQAKINPELMSIMSQLKQSMTFSPEAMELDRQSSLLQYVPRNVYAHTHPTFPLAPQFTTQTELADLFERLPMDTLFFVFYFQQGTYQQFLAARQLKKHSWRFHKKYMTWFQRHEEPKVATEEYEEGTYVYFDYESGWCQRIKSEFKFEYAYLEDELGGAGDA